jgi:tetratricopeptide (TPR) repeat protein
MRLVEVLHGLDRVEDACTHLEEILRRDPEHRDARAILAALEAKAGRVDEAITSYTLLIAVEEGEPLVNVTLAFADLCEEHGRLEELVPALERARREVPANEAIETRLRAAYTALGENRALADLILDEAAHQDDASEKFASLSKAARLLMDPDKGDPVRAMTVLADARSLRPDDPDNGVLLADALIASGKIGEALDLLEQLVAGQKRRSKVRSLMHSRIADLYTKMGAQMGALQSLVKAMDDDPHDAALAMRAGLGAVELNDVDAMTRAFRTVTLMKTVPLGVTEGGAPAQAKCLAYYHLARVAQRQGDQRKARLMIEKSLGEFPTPEARALRDSLKG